MYDLLEVHFLSKFMNPLRFIHDYVFMTYYLITFKMTDIGHNFEILKNYPF